MCLLIQVILGYKLYLSIILSKGSSEVFLLLKKMWLLVMLILGTIFTKYFIKTLATFTSFLIISPDSSKKMFSVDFILLENRGFTVAQNFLLSLMSFKFKFS